VFAPLVGALVFKASPPLPSSSNCCRTWSAAMLASAFGSTSQTGPAQTGTLSAA